MKREHNFSSGRRGRVVPVPTGKTRITIRIDDDILEWFRDQVDRAGGGSYQSLMNRALRAYVEESTLSLEETLRRVFREEVVERLEDLALADMAREAIAEHEAGGGERVSLDEAFGKRD